MKNILVTGGAGYIGSHTVVELVAAGYNPIILDNFVNSKNMIVERLEKLTKRSLAVYKQDYQDIKKLKVILEKEKIDGVIHFAAHKSVAESVTKPYKYYENNVVGFLELLNELQKSGVHNIVFSSSCTVYGQPDEVPITESSPIKKANSPYGAAKQMCEAILEDMTSAHGMRSLSLRYFNAIGAHPTGMIGELPIGAPTYLVPYLTQAVAGKLPELVVHGSDYPTKDGTCVRDYVHVVDLARAHIKALEFLQKQPLSTYGTYNIGTGQGSSVLEVIKTFQRVTGKKVPYAIGPRRAGDVMSVYASTDSALRSLDWKAQFSLEDALRDAWNWQESLK